MTRPLGDSLFLRASALVGQRSRHDIDEHFEAARSSHRWENVAHASLHEGMYDFVLRFAREQNIGSLDDLARLDIVPTPKQRAESVKRVERTRDPIEFAVAWTDKFVADKYGEATTHWRKLMDRVTRGVGNPCPLVLIRLPASIVKFPVATTPEETAAAIEETGSAGAVARCYNPPSSRIECEETDGSINVDVHPSRDHFVFR